MLTAGELERAWRLHRPRDRLRFVAGRGLLRQLLAAYLGVESEAILFEYADFGKPRLAAGTGAQALSFNASGSEGLALVAVARGLEVGVDVEHVHEIPDLPALARRLLDDEARGAMARAEPAERTRLFLEHWVRHEALAKASGLGLRQLQRATGTAAMLPSPATGFVAAVAATLPFERVQCRSLGEAG